MERYTFLLDNWSLFRLLDPVWRHSSKSKGRPRGSSRAQAVNAGIRRSNEWLNTMCALEVEFKHLIVVAEELEARDAERIVREFRKKHKETWNPPLPRTAAAVRDGRGLVGMWGFPGLPAEFLLCPVIYGLPVVGEAETAWEIGKWMTEAGAFETRSAGCIPAGCILAGPATLRLLLTPDMRMGDGVHKEALQFAVRGAMDLVTCYARALVVVEAQQGGRCLALSMRGVADAWNQHNGIECSQDVINAKLLFPDLDYIPVCVYGGSVVAVRLGSCAEEVELRALQRSMCSDFKLEMPLGKEVWLDSRRFGSVARFVQRVEDEDEAEPNCYFVAVEAPEPVVVLVFLVVSAVQLESMYRERNPAELCLRARWKAKSLQNFVKGKMAFAT